jgi:hypothetical protein
MWCAGLPVAKAAAQALGVCRCTGHHVCAGLGCIGIKAWEGCCQAKKQKALGIVWMMQGWVLSRLIFCMLGAAWQSYFGSGFLWACSTGCVWLSIHLSGFGVGQRSAQTLPRRFGYQDSCVCTALLQIWSHSFPLSDAASHRHAAGTYI